MNKDDTVAVIRSLLSSTNSPYSIYNLNKDFKNETGINIPLFGCSNISDFLCSIPETAKITGTYPIQRVSLVTNQKSAHIVSLVKRQKNTGQKKICLSRSKSHGRKPTIDTSVTLNIAGSFRSKDVQGTQTVLEKKDFNDFNGENENFENKTPSDMKEVPPMDLDLRFSLNSSKVLIPLKYFCCTEEIIPPIDIELHARVGEYIEVCPCQIFSPHKFYFHFRKFKKKFENFFEKLQIFYSTHEIPAVEKELIRPQQVYAVFYKIFFRPEWHRVEIQEIVGDYRVIVNFIDCGNTIKISAENLKLLHRNFAYLPRQAVMGVLANIRPLKGGSKWSLRAIKKFYNLAFRKALIAGVVEVDSKTYCMKVALSYTKNSEIHINDTLVKGGYAEFDINVLNSHFTDILKKTNLWSKATEDFKPQEPDSHETVNTKKEFFKNCLHSVQGGTSPTLRTPIYFPNDCSKNNNRLKKMFSLVKEE